MKKIILRNFQPHRKLEVPLDPKVTIITGDSFTGKSAIWRALYLLTFNRPSGGKYVRRGTTACRVAVGTNGNKVVARAYKTGRWKYHVGDEVYLAAGTKVPGAVRRALNLGPVNFQRQDEPHLWLYESPGQVAKKLNEVADLETMDRVMAHIARQVRDSAAEVRVVRSRLDEANGLVEQTEWVPAVVRKAQRIVALETQHSANLAQLRHIERCIRQAGLHRSAIFRLSGANVTRKKVCQTAARVLTIQKQRENLQDLVNRTKQAQTSSRIKWPDISPILESRIKADKYAERRRELELLIQQIQERSDQWQDLVSQLKRTQLSSEPQSDKQCPLCGSLLSARSVS
jgi:exonuclease SbcC